ncbi:cyclin-dependent kinase F-1 [Diospyros lotus]|uniref:cyclin-dependent kinase F-1 n=1 Tax=Diospyros lotus TaxID=55363 RepID=UPI00224CEBAF|nr:cyclin-dependent kinase F-1 [Diospyros lotus]
MEPQSPTPPKSWSIHTRKEIITNYEILERVGSGAYADVYRARRRSDSVIVALKEVHDYQSAFREIDALQALKNSPNVIVLHEYFWREDEDAVLVLEFLPTDLASVVSEAKKDGGISAGEIKRWIIQILSGVDACHRNSIVHRDLKPSNLLISADGVLKLADFGQARILLEPGFVSFEENLQPHEQNDPDPNVVQPLHGILEREVPCNVASGNEEHGSSGKDGCFEQLDELKTKDAMSEIDYETHDGDTSCLATCTTSDIEDDPFHGSYSYEAQEGGDGRDGPLTSCVGTRWFRAPELLYGSTKYGAEIDLWSLGCIFAELFSLEPLFPGTSDIDQLSRIFSVLGTLSEEIWPGCVELPDYKIISFSKVENPLGLEACLPNRSPDEINLVKKLLCFDPAGRATAMELLQDKYLTEPPLPVPVSELRVPSSRTARDDEDSPGEWCDYRHMDSDSDFEDFGSVNVTATDSGFSIRFP